ncbi:hypothetical protein V8C86DRAFT_2581821 [Haematococcus lacustris]
MQSAPPDDSALYQQLLGDVNALHAVLGSPHRLEDSSGSSGDEGTEAEEDEEQGDEGCTSSGSVGSDERDGRDGVGGSAGLLTEKELLAQLGMEGLEGGDISSLRDMVDSFVGVFGAADSPAGSGPVDTQPPLSDVSEDEVGQSQGPQGQGCHSKGFQQRREFVGALLSPSAPQAAVKTAQSQPAAAARATPEPASAVMGSPRSGTQGLNARPLTPLRLGAPAALC